MGWEKLEDAVHEITQRMGRKRQRNGEWKKQRRSGKYRGNGKRKRRRR